jgi:hypothetical protein
MSFDDHFREKTKKKEEYFLHRMTIKKSLQKARYWLYIDNNNHIFMNWVMELAPQNFLWWNSACTVSDIVELPENIKTRLLNALWLNPTWEIQNKITRLVRDALVNNPLEWDEKQSTIDINTLEVPKWANITEVLQVFGNIFAEKDFMSMDAIAAIQSLEHVMRAGIVPSQKLFELTLQNRPLMWQWYMSNSFRSRSIISRAYRFFNSWFRQNIGRLTQEEIDAFNRFMQLLEQSLN